jgi:hypothetical protein
MDTSIKIALTKIGRKRDGDMFSVVFPSNLTYFSFIWYSCCDRGFGRQLNPPFKSSDQSNIPHKRFSICLSRKPTVFFSFEVNKYVLANSAIDYYTVGSDNCLFAFLNFSTCFQAVLPSNCFCSQMLEQKMSMFVF